MKKKLIASGVVASMVMATGASGIAAAQSATGAASLSMQNAIGIALDQVPGKVKEAELDRENGRQIYEIDIVTDDGRKMEVEVDANTGEVLKVEEDT